MVFNARKKGPNGICDMFELKVRDTKKKQIFLLEPDTTYVQFLRPHFESKGYEMRVFTNGMELRSEIELHMPDLFIAEAMAPQFNGFELREKLIRMSDGLAVPFILVSHRKDEAFIQRAADLGILFFLEKPFSRRELFGIVDNLLR